MQRAATVEGLTAVIRPDAGRLRVPVDVAVAFVEAAIAGTHARIDHLLPVPPARVMADALVNGIAGPAPTTAHPAEGPAPAARLAATATKNREP
jgi:hypothetical protein